MRKTIYYFNEATRAYVGEGFADQDPLDRGRWLIPSNATDIEPPSASADTAAVFTTDKWALVPRGTVPSA